MPLNSSDTDLDDIAVVLTLTDVLASRPQTSVVARVTSQWISMVSSSNLINKKRERGN